MKLRSAPKNSRVKVLIVALAMTGKLEVGLVEARESVLQPQSPAAQKTL
jgi:hypothetical protein